MKKFQTINIILLLGMSLSCSSSKINTEKNQIVHLIKQFNLQFRKKSNSKLSGVIIRRSGSLVTIKDVPKNAMLGYISEVDEQKDFSKGIVSGIICLYNADEWKIEKNDFKEIPYKLIRESRKNSSIVINGKKINFANNDIEWNPELEITYDLNSLN